MARTNVTRFKIRQRSRVQLNGIGFTLQDLSAHELDESIVRATERFNDFEAPGHHFIAELKAQVLSRALVPSIHEDQIRDCFLFAELNQLFDSWKTLHDNAIPDGEQLYRDLVKGFLQDSAIKAEAVRAKSAKGPVEYFGSAMCSITDAQLAFYNTLCNVWDEMERNDGRNHAISQKWLDGRIRN